MAGIEQLIQQKEDAYRSNPQALEQKYSQNKQLIDLLAMQKLKSEKESAARDMQLQMQQNPQTIAQQLEQELMTRTKEEAVQQVGDLAKQNQSKKQNNLNKVAAQGIPSIKPPTPRAAPTAPQQAPARPQQAPPVRAAQGGIMRYASGGLTSVTVTPEEIAAYRKRSDPRTNQSVSKLSDAAIKERILDQRRVELVRKSNRTALDRTPNPHIPVSDELAAFDKARAGGETPTPKAPRAPEAGSSVGPINAAGIPSLLAKPQPEVEEVSVDEASVEQAVNTGGVPIDRTTTTSSTVTVPQGGDSSQMSAQQGSTTYSPAATASPDIGKDSYIQKMLDNFGGPDAQARGAAQQEAYGKDVDREGIAALYAKQRGRLADYDKAAGSEENNRAARQRATLLGIAQGGLRGGAAADANLRSAQQRNQRKIFKDDLNMEMAAKAKDIELAQKGMEFGQKAEQQQNTANTALLQAATSLGRDETTRIENQANRENQATLSRLKISSDKAIAEMSRVDTTSANASKDKLTNAYLLKDIGDRIKESAAEINEAISNSTAYEEYDAALRDAKGAAKGSTKDVALQRASNVLAIYRATLEQGSGLPTLRSQYNDMSKKLGLSTPDGDKEPPKVNLDDVLGAKLLTGENIPR